jgi:hypothetical protein
MDGNSSKVQRILSELETWVAIWTSRRHQSKSWRRPRRLPSRFHPALGYGLAKPVQHPVLLFLRVSEHLNLLFKRLDNLGQHRLSHKLGKRRLLKLLGLNREAKPSINARRTGSELALPLKVIYVSVQVVQCRLTTSHFCWNQVH